MVVDASRLYERLFAVLEEAVGQGLDAAALVDKAGDPVALEGDLDPDEARPLASMVMYRLKTPDLSARLFAGEILTLKIDDDRVAAVCVAKRQLFVVAVFPALTLTMLSVVGRVRDGVERLLAEMPPGVPPPWSGGAAGGSGSGPADLSLVELGLTVLRKRAKA